MWLQVITSSIERGRAIHSKNSPRFDSSCSKVAIAVRVKDGFPTRDYHMLKLETCLRRRPPNLEKHCIWSVNSFNGSKVDVSSCFNVCRISSSFSPVESMFGGNPIGHTPFFGPQTNPIHSTRDSLVRVAIGEEIISPNWFRPNILSGDVAGSWFNQFPSIHHSSEDPHAIIQKFGSICRWNGWYWAKFRAIPGFFHVSTHKVFRPASLSSNAGSNSTACETGGTWWNLVGTLGAQPSELEIIHEWLSKATEDIWRSKVHSQWIVVDEKWGYEHPENECLNSWTWSRRYMRRRKLGNQPTRNGVAQSNNTCEELGYMYGV